MPDKLTAGHQNLVYRVFVQGDLLTIPDPALPTLPSSSSIPLSAAYHRWKAKDNPRCITLSDKCGTSQARSSCTVRPTWESLTSRAGTGWSHSCLKNSKPCSYPIRQQYDVCTKIERNPQIKKDPSCNRHGRAPLFWSFSLAPLSNNHRYGPNNHV